MAAFDAEIVDALREVESLVAFDPQVPEGIQPLGAGVEVADLAFELPFADLDVPGTEPGALKAGPLDDAILIEAAVVIGDERALHVVVGQRVEVPGVSHTGPVLHGINLQCLAPPESGFDQCRFVMERRPFGTVDDNRFELLRPEDRAAAVRRRVIVIIAQHRRVHHVLPCRTDAHHPGIFDADVRPQQILGLA